MEASLVQRFIEEGFIHLEQAFPRPLADECREILWRDTGCNPRDPKTWTRPVVRLGDHAEAPFRQAANTARLRAAFDRIVGPGRWAPRTSLGTFPVRFPSREDPGDAGWHADASYYSEDGTPWLDVTSRGRAMLMLFLFSAVREGDAPTRIRVGSHLDVVRLLEPAGGAGMSFLELAEKLKVTERRPVALAVGEPGDVYLCHPFLVHAAQPHRGTVPRFIAQPPLLSAEPLRLHREDGSYSPVESAIRLGLAGEAKEITTEQQQGGAS